MESNQYLAIKEQVFFPIDQGICGLLELGEKDKSLWNHRFLQRHLLVFITCNFVFFI